MRARTSTNEGLGTSANDPLAAVERISPRRSPDVRALMTAWTLPADSDIPDREEHHGRARRACNCGARSATYLMPPSPPGEEPYRPRCLADPSKARRSAATPGRAGPRYPERPPPFTAPLVEVKTDAGLVPEVESTAGR